MALDPFWLADKPEDYDIKEDRTVILQPMKNDTVVVELGPYIMEFGSPEERQEALMGDGINAVVDWLDAEIGQDVHFVQLIPAGGKDDLPTEEEEERLRPFTIDADEDTE